jgi:hypothetical protein
VVASGLLASWELIGITLQTKEKWGIELKSPAGVPLILFVLVLYSGYKLLIEWTQCDAERRKHLAAKVDYWVAHGIALIAIAISIVQYMTRIQIIDFLNKAQPDPSKSFFGMMLLIPVAGLGLADLLKKHKSFSPKWLHATLNVLLALCYASILALGIADGIRVWKSSIRSFVINLSGGLFLGVVGLIVFGAIGKTMFAAAAKFLSRWAPKMEKSPMMSLVFFTHRLPSKIANDLIRAGFQVFEALTFSEAVHLCETKQISMVVIDADVEEPLAKVIRMLHYTTLHLKPEATVKDVSEELLKLFLETAEKVH